MSQLDELRRAARLASRLRNRDRIDAKALARTVPYVIEAIDQHARGVELPRAEQLFGRAAAISHAQFTATDRGAWPGAGSFDQDAQAIAQHIANATHQTNQDPRPADPTQVERLLSSIVWNCTETLADESLRHARRVQVDQAFGELSAEHADIEVGASALVRERAQAVSHAVAPGVFNTEETQSPTQLEAAIARWDITAHRTLLTYRSTIALTLIAHHEAGIADMLEASVRRVNDTGPIDDVAADRIATAAHEVSTGWKDALTLLRDLQWGQDSVPAELTSAAREVRDALMATSDPSAVTKAAGSHIASATSLVLTAQELLTERQLRAPARGVNAFAKEHLSDQAVGSVGLHAIAKNATIELPSTVRAALSAPLQRTIEASRTALSTTAILDGPPRKSVVDEPLPRVAPPPRPDLAAIAGTAGLRV